jgi:hypothetical protein
VKVPDRGTLVFTANTSLFEEGAVIVAVRVEFRSCPALVEKLELGIKPPKNTCVPGVSADRTSWHEILRPTI